LLLAHFGWPSVFVALVPVALIAAALAYKVVPESSNPQEARLDPSGLALSTLTIGALVYTIIEAPSRGWTAPASIVGFALAAVAAGLFVQTERRRENPMLDVTLFRTPAFSAASGAVTVAFFALFGFIFLVTQYFQFIRGYGTLSTGVRILPVAITIAIGSVLGAQLVQKVGTKIIVMTGLLLFGSAFAWISVSPVDMSYARIVAQMVLMGIGLGLTSTPATESILSVLSPAKAGVGSAVNDATREAGGTLGVAVIGSIFTSIYVHHLSTTQAAQLPQQAAQAAKNSVAAAIQIPGIRDAVQNSFMSGMHVACIVAAGVCWLGAIGAMALPGRAQMKAKLPTPAPCLAEAA
jgi:predicted MFS family arabinose efflux permease